MYWKRGRGTKGAPTWHLGQGSQYHGALTQLRGGQWIMAWWNLTINKFDEGELKEVQAAVEMIVRLEGRLGIHHPPPN